MTVAIAEPFTCREMVELVTEYLEGTLPPDARARFEDHLADCDGCTNYLDQMRETLRLMGGLSEESIDPLARDRLLHAFRDWKTGGPGSGSG